MSHIALLGGSFNPPHVAHQMAALWALSCPEVDQIWFMPAHQHPFGKELVDFEHRVAMCRLACAPFDPTRVRVTRVEEEDPEETRTLFTLRLLADRYPKHRFALVIGADILAEKENWYQFDEIQRLVQLMVLGRGGYPEVEGAPTLPEISSSEVRRRIAWGKDISGHVPAPVREFIQHNGLYRGRRK